jgi:hypothetical protein
MNYQQMVLDIQSYFANRRSNILTYWDFYLGDNQKYYITKFAGEDEKEFSDRQERACVENHCAKTSDTIVGYLYGSPETSGKVKVVVRNRSDKKVNQKAMDFLTQRIWTSNDMDAFRVNVGLMSSVTGVAIVHKVFVDSRTDLPFKPWTSKEDRAKYGYVRYDLWESADTVPIPLVDEQNVVHSGVFGGVIRITQPDAKKLMDNPMTRVANLENTSYLAEYFDAERYAQMAIDRGSVKAGTEKETKNPYKSIHIPFTLFRNYGNPMGLEGYSDLDQMLSLQTTLNELSTDDKTCIDYHSFPLLKLLKGGKMPANFVRKANSALELDGDQDAEYLTWDNVLDASEKKQESIRKQMTVVSGVSQLSRGNAESVGDVKGATALKTLFQADINEIGLKIPFFRAAEQRLALTTLQMWQMETGESFGDVYVECEFPADFIGLDKLLAAQTDQLEITSGIASIREKIAARHPEITSEKELDEMVKEVIDEMKKVAEAQAGPQPPPGQQGQSPAKKSQEQNL